MSNRFDILPYDPNGSDADDYEELFSLKDINGETDKAVMYPRSETENQWVPISLCRELDGTVYVAKWFIEKNGLD